ncbi:hypothetical protein BESB_064920 [Besnoitia besnoiti]|uniref:RRM domain-containing protein n=1 Tax=Besnoitia besnoiti TaxID=94643 RepID=A0A2A9MDW7_BESBE|nr:hypothetical protein BESB_064920 [Besnoitia besnoiti]PFH34461.1 hypothetical protein BESB_064920 [Besnoitia besnoiti]
MSLVPPQLQQLLQLSALANGCSQSRNLPERIDDANLGLSAFGTQGGLLSEPGNSAAGIGPSGNAASSRNNYSGSSNVSVVSGSCGTFPQLVVRSNDGAVGGKHGGHMYHGGSTRGSPAAYGCASPGSRETSPQQPGRTFVGNIPPDITRVSVKRLAERYGTVIGVEYDPQPGKWAYAYIIFATSTMADRAAGAMHGKRAFEHAEFHRLVSCRCAKDFPLTRLPLTKMDLPCLNTSPPSDGSLSSGNHGVHTPTPGLHGMDPRSTNNSSGVGVPMGQASPLTVGWALGGGSLSVSSATTPGGVAAPLSAASAASIVSPPINTNLGALHLGGTGQGVSSMCDASSSYSGMTEGVGGGGCGSSVSTAVGGSSILFSHQDFSCSISSPSQSASVRYAGSYASAETTTYSTSRSYQHGGVPGPQPSNLNADAAAAAFSGNAGSEAEGHTNAATGVLAALGGLGSRSAIQGMRIGPRRSCVLDPAVIQEQARKTTFTLLRDGPPGANLFIYGIPACWKELELMVLVGQFGHVVGIRVPPASSTVVPPSSNFPPGGPIGSSNTNTTLLSCCSYNRGFGFASYDNTSAAFEAFRQLSGLTVAGKALKIQLKNGEEHLLDSALKAMAATNAHLSAATGSSANLTFSGGTLGGAAPDAGHRGAVFFNAAHATAGSSLVSGRSWGRAASPLGRAHTGGPTSCMSPSWSTHGAGGAYHHTGNGLQFALSSSVSGMPVKHLAELSVLVAAAMNQQTGEKNIVSVEGPSGSLNEFGGGGTTGPSLAPTVALASSSAASECEVGGGRDAGKTSAAPDPFLAATAAGLSSLLAASGGSGKGTVTSQQQVLLQQAFSTMSAAQKQQLLRLLAQPTHQEAVRRFPTTVGAVGCGSHGKTGGRFAQQWVAGPDGLPGADSSGVDPGNGSSRALGLSLSLYRPSSTLRKFLIGELSHHQPSKAVFPPSEKTDLGSETRDSPLRQWHLQSRQAAEDSLSKADDAASNSAIATSSSFSHGTTGADARDGDGALVSNPAVNCGDAVGLPLGPQVAGASACGAPGHLGEWATFSGGAECLFGSLLGQHASGLRTSMDTEDRHSLEPSGDHFPFAEDDTHHVGYRGMPWFPAAPGEAGEGGNFAFGREDVSAPLPCNAAPGERPVPSRWPWPGGIPAADSDALSRRSSGGTHMVSASFSVAAAASEFCAAPMKMEGEEKGDGCASRATSCPVGDDFTGFSGSEAFPPVLPVCGVELPGGGEIQLGRGCTTAHTLVQQLAQCVSMLASPAGLFRQAGAPASLTLEEMESCRGEATGGGDGERRRRRDFGRKDHEGCNRATLAKEAEEESAGRSPSAESVPRCHEGHLEGASRVWEAAIGSGDSAGEEPQEGREERGCEAAGAPGEAESVVSLMCA